VDIYKIALLDVFLPFFFTQSVVENKNYPLFSTFFAVVEYFITFFPHFIFCGKMWKTRNSAYICQENTGLSCGLWKTS